MSTLQRNHQCLPPINRFPVEECEALTAFLITFPEAVELVVTNPPLAVILANGLCLDAFTMAEVE